MQRPTNYIHRPTRTHTHRHAHRHARGCRPSPPNLTRQRGHVRKGQAVGRPTHVTPSTPQRLQAFPARKQQRFVVSSNQWQPGESHSSSQGLDKLPGAPGSPGPCAPQTPPRTYLHEERQRGTRSRRSPSVLVSASRRARVCSHLGVRSRLLGELLLSSPEDDVSQRAADALLSSCPRKPLWGPSAPTWLPLDTGPLGG